MARALCFRAVDSFIKISFFVLQFKYREALCARTIVWWWLRDVIPVSYNSGAYTDLQDNYST